MRTSPIERPSYGRGCIGVRKFGRGIAVSLSDWLAFQARIRGFENPRLLRDRPSDGAALVSKKLCGVGWCEGTVLQGCGVLRALAMAGDWSTMTAAK